mgnify:CR=1 FL=1
MIAILNYNPGLSHLRRTHVVNSLNEYTVELISFLMEDYSYYSINIRFVINHDEYLNSNSTYLVLKSKSGQEEKFLNKTIELPKKIGRDTSKEEIKNILKRLFKKHYSSIWDTLDEFEEINDTV